MRGNSLTFGYLTTRRNPRYACAFEKIKKRRNVQEQGVSETPTKINTRRYIVEKIVLSSAKRASATRSASSYDL
jgi:hypothetical protein